MGKSKKGSVSAALRLMKNPSIFGSSQKRGVLIPICSRFESVTFRESEAILTLPEVCQQPEPGTKPGFEVLPDLLDYLHFWIAASAAEMPFRE
ncbi:hypothetical protein BR141012304_10471 [Brucella inopinata]|nr:hypothetical protein BR141012304_10471 [Brucella inopinata]